MKIKAKSTILLLAAVGLPIYAGTAESINQVAVHGLDDTSLVIREKKVVLYGIQTNGPDTKMENMDAPKWSP